MKKQLMTTLIVLALLALLSACTANSTLVDTNWQLTSLAGQPPLKDVEVTLSFSKDAFGGNDGCNAFGGGSYEVKEESISFGNDYIATMMYCTDEIAAQYNIFYDALKQAASYKVTDASLALMDANGTISAEFSKIQS